MFDLHLALDDEDRTPGGDRLDYFRQPVGQCRHTIHIPQPPTRFGRIRSLLTKCLFTLAAFCNDESAVGVLVFDALDNEQRRASLVLIVKFRRHDLPRLAGAVPAIGLRRRLAGQRRAGGYEVDAVEVFDELDHVAADATATAIPDALLRVDGKAILAAALWARADPLNAAT